MLFTRHITCIVAIAACWLSVYAESGLIPVAHKASKTDAAQNTASTPAPAPVPVVTTPVAGSLWTDSTSSLYTLRQYHVGDILTVLITQASSTSTSANHSTAKASTASVDPTTGLLKGFKGLGVNANRSTSGSGSSTTNTVITDTATVTVTQVLPNGNLTVQGKRQVKLEQDIAQLSFTGEVRPADISPETNSVSSTLIANLHLESKGEGPIAEKQRTGLFSRLLAWLW